jgi:hypothetical protein
LLVALLGFPPAAAALALATAWSARREGASLAPPGRGSRRGVGRTLRAASPFAGSELLSQF